MLLFLTRFVTLLSVVHCASIQPHIILILADDLGFNDLSFRGSNLIPTPNIDALAYSGRILNRHYVLPTCTPSRSSLLTGIQPISLGTQGYPLKAGQRGGVPCQHKLIPGALKELGYKTHMTGKWHLGFESSLYLPTSRGFNSFLGYYNGFIDYYRLDLNQTHDNGTFFGYDMHDGTRPRWDLQGQYATDIFTERAVEVIKNHDVSSPLFLYVSHLAAHTGTTEGDGLQLPPKVNADERYPYINKKERRNYAAVVQSLDESVGKIVQTLGLKKMLNNSVILFLADNGAASVESDMQPNFGSNWPLRGSKFTLYEGGVRGAAVFWSSQSPGGAIDNNIYHISDWWDILAIMAGGKARNTESYKLHRQLFSKTSKAISRDLLINIDELANSEAVLLNSRWKIVKQNMRDYANYDFHYEVQLNGSGIPKVTTKHIKSSNAGKTLQDLGYLTNDKPITALRQQAMVNCTPTNVKPMGYVKPSKDFFCKDYCVFDVISDPCELVPLNKPDILAKGKGFLQSQRSFLIPQNNNPVDVLSDPNRFDRVWTPWFWV